MAVMLTMPIPDPLLQLVRYEVQETLFGEHIQESLRWIFSVALNL